MSGSELSSQFSPIPTIVLADLDRQRAYVAELLRASFPGTTLEGSNRDFATLQRIVDAKIIGPRETWQLQALGVVFGDALLGLVDGLSWCLVTDAFGTDPTLRFRQTTVQVNVLTMISKRVEDGQSFDVQELADGVVDFILNSAREYR